MFYKFICLFLIAVSLSACATVEQPASTTALHSKTPLPVPTGITHVVQQGETLWRISQAYHADLDDILKANHISDATVIAAGQAIVIPGASKTANFKTNFAPRTAETDFIWPIKGKIIAHFREKYEGVLNKGIDIQTGPSQDVVASCQGKVAFVGTIAGYGPTLIIDHEDGLSSVYCGNTTITVKPGDAVTQGMLVAKTGNPLINGPETLHFEIRKKHKPQNPLYYLTN